MKYKTMYGLHELRMWLTTIIGGIAALGTVTAMHPELIDNAKDKVSRIKNKFGKPKQKIKFVVVDNEEKP